MPIYMIYVPGVLGQPRKTNKLHAKEYTLECGAILQVKL